MKVYQHRKGCYLKGEPQRAIDAMGHVCHKPTKAELESEAKRVAVVYAYNDYSY